MENQRRVLCPENEELALFMWSKRQELAEPKGIPERFDSTLYKAYCNVCNTKTPIKTLKEFSQIKGVGKLILRIMQGFFKKDTDGSQVEQVSPNGKKKTKGTRRYMPQKNSVAYALLITLYRGTTKGKDFMKKQELIDAAEASGLSRVPIQPELGKGKQGQFGSSARVWYSGWSCMKTLIAKGLVAKSNVPAKYMLTEEGHEAARECLSRSGLADCVDNLDTTRKSPSKDGENASDSEAYCTLSGEITVESINLSSREKSLDVPIEYLEKFTHMGYSVEQIRTAFAKVSQDTLSKDVSSLLPAVIHHLQKDQVDVLLSVCRTSGKHSETTSNTYNVKNVGRAGSFVEENGKISRGGAIHGPDSLSSADSEQSPFTLRACSSSGYTVLNSSDHDAVHTIANVLMVPPLRLEERFGDVYDVILILDEREQFLNSNKGYRSRKIVENIRTEFKIQIEIRRLPVGDAIWIARHKQLEDEYVLDFIVERKQVEDLRCSIRDNRYRDQKLRILRCGLQKMIYLVEGDPNVSEAAEAIKTACFTTEILEGFDVQRTSGLGDTFRKYGYLTIAITHHYRTFLSSDNNRNTRTCPSFDDFLKKCQDLEKITVSDVFAIQLMQVPQVTEEIALAVLGFYPTSVSLARAYSLLDGDICTQEELLMTQSNNLIGRGASKNIFKFVWGG